MKVDFKRQLKQLYAPSAKAISVVDIPEMSFLMIDGAGNPNTATAYKQAVAALFAVSYALKFAVKRGAGGIDYGVMPLEGLWWTADGRPFSPARKEEMLWTMMIMQPEYVTPTLFEQARKEVAQKKDLPALPRLRLETLREGSVAQIMHIDAYDDEAPAIARLHAFIAEQGRRLHGKHHEIYLSDPTRTAPEKLKTILRQPFV